MLDERGTDLDSIDHTLIAKEQQLEERKRRLDQLERDLAEREHPLRGSDVRWWGADPASSH